MAALIWVAYKYILHPLKYRGFDVGTKLETGKPIHTYSCGYVAHRNSLCVSSWRAVYDAQGQDGCMYEPSPLIV